MRKMIVRPGEQDRQRDLVRRPLSLGALDEGDHPVEEGLAGVGRDRTTIRSLTSVVPPVTELRMSVPGSLRTGADSPVIAASLTNPMPSMTSPSPAIVSPSSTTMMSPLRSSDEPTSSRVPSARRRWAVVSERVLRRVAAWARPRASATASAYVANRTVNHSQIAIWIGNPRPPGAGRLGAGHVGDRDERHEDRGDLDDEHDRVLDQQARVELAERVRDGGPEEVRVEDAPRLGRLAGGLRATEGDEALEAAGAATEIDGHESHQETFPAFWRSCSTIGPSASAGKNVSAPTMITTPMSRTTHRTPVVGNVPSDGATLRLARHRAGEGQDRDDHPVAADEHREAAGDVVEGRVAGQAGEGRAVVARLAARRRTGSR